IRDRAAREQRLTAQVELILDEVDRLEREQKWPEALSAAERAKAVLAGGEPNEAVRQRVHYLLRELAFVARLDHIRQESGADDLAPAKYLAADRNYAEAFRDSGTDVEALPTDEAVARLRARPELALAIAASLDDWTYIRTRRGLPLAARRPLIGLARRLDTD